MGYERDVIEICVLERCLFWREKFCVKEMSVLERCLY